MSSGAPSRGRRAARAAGRALAGVVLLQAWRRRRRARAAPLPEAPSGPDPTAHEPRDDRRAETIVLACLLAAVVCAGAFIAVYAASADTQLLGLTLGLALALLSVASIVAGKRVVPQDTRVEERARLEHPKAVDEVDEAVAGAGEGVSRRGLVLGAAGVAGGALGAALAVPAASLGPRLSPTIRETLWHRGRRLLDTAGRPYAAARIEPGTLYTALPEGADPSSFGASLAVVRLRPGELRLPPERRSWAVDGIVAYSKVCPHAGCAVSIYRQPLYRPASRRPALVCPCHYSTFDPARAGKLLFGPAGRNLPQLPLLVDDAGNLRAAAGFAEDPGPSWWHVDRG